MREAPWHPGRLGALAAVAVVAWPVPVSAYRPFNSTDAAVAALREVEIELGPVGYLVQGPDRALVVPSLVVNWGFASGWEAVLEGRHLVELGGAIQEPRLRVDDTALSVKGVLREGTLQGKTGPSVATELSVLLPTVHSGSGVGAECALIVSQRWPDLTVHVNGAAAWTRARTLGAFGGAIFEGPDAWTIRPVGEVFVEHEGDLPTTLSGLLGAIWRVSDGLSFDAAVRRARAGSVNTTELRLGFTWTVSVGFPR